MIERVYAALAAGAALLFPAAGLATEFGHLAPAAFVAVSLGCCTTFAATTWTLSRRPAQAVAGERPSRRTFVRPAAYLQ